MNHLHGGHSEDFASRYRDLESRMKSLAEADGDVFLPNPEPSGPVDYVFIAMEPSLGGGTPGSVHADIAAGARNFVNSIEDFILHFSIQHYLCKSGERYHITDISKGAMLVQRAPVEREQRYDRWFGLLIEELDLVAKPDATFFTVGKAVEDHLRKRPFPKPLAPVIHYSSQNALGPQEVYRAVRG